jgi:hypothetical protein
MATAIPEAFTFALQSRLPANSFVVSWKEFRPDNAPRDGKSFIIQGDGSTSERIRMHLRGAPNEFLLNTNTYLLASSYTELTQASNSIYPQLDYVFSDTGKIGLLLNDIKPVNNGSQIDYFSGSRESFNSGALPYLDNQDSTNSHIINNIRSTMARRNYSNQYCKTKYDMSGCLSGTANQVVGYEDTDVQDTANLIKDQGLRYWTIRTSIDNAGNKQNTYELLTDGSNNLIQLPLGYFSNLVNSHSVVPLGLMSSYSVNGWSIELNTQSAPFGKQADFCGEINTGVELPHSYFSLTVGQNPGVVPHIINWVGGRRVMSDVRIYAPVVQILDPSVMDSVLSLYEKRQMVNLGGVQFPLSLRMNSLAFRYSRYPVGLNGQSDYHFRIAGTDRSVRALAWWVSQDSNVTSVGDMTLSTPLVLTRLETKYGNQHIHEVIEDRTPDTNNITNFLNINARKSGGLFSPLPQYQEGKKFDGQSEDVLSRLNNAFARVRIQEPLDGLSGSKTFVKNSVCCGVVSFENLDRREGDHAGSYQASGIDLTNVGSIELDMRFQSTSLIPFVTKDNSTVPTQAEKDLWIQFAPPSTNYTINFVYVYDSVMEISPSGVMDITNAVL